MVAADRGRSYSGLTRPRVVTTAPGDESLLIIGADTPQVLILGNKLNCLNTCWDVVSTWPRKSRKT